MNLKKSRPKIKINRKAIDWAIELIAISFLIILIGLPLVNYNNLPETIPIHFSGSGQPDGFGSRSTLWLLPLSGIFLYLLMTIIEGFPQIYNYLVEITPGNAFTQYKMATRLIRILKTMILIIFSYISFKTIKTATGTAAGLGKAFIPIFLLITLGVIIIYITRSLNNRQSG